MNEDKSRQKKRWLGLGGRNKKKVKIASKRTKKEEEETEGNWDKSEYAKKDHKGIREEIGKFRKFRTYSNNPRSSERRRRASSESFSLRRSSKRERRSFTNSSNIEMDLRTQHTKR